MIDPNIRFPLGGLRLLSSEYRLFEIEAELLHVTIRWLPALSPFQARVEWASKRVSIHEHLRHRKLFARQIATTVGH